MTSPSETGEALPDTSRMTTRLIHVNVEIMEPVGPDFQLQDEITSKNTTAPRGVLRLHLDAELEDPRDLNGKVRARIGKRITDLLKQYERTHYPVQLGSEVQELAGGREVDEPSTQGIG